MGMQYSPFRSKDYLPVPRYGFGGDLWKSSILGGGAGNSPYALLGGIGSELVGTIDGMDGKTSAFGDSASNALKFGSMGATIGGPWGALAGGLLGTGIGLFTHNKEEREKARMEAEAREKQTKQLRMSDQMNSQAILSSYPTKGVQSPGFYKLGGSVSPQYQVEGGEIMFAPDSLPPVTDKFGKASKIAPNTFKFTGASHNAPSGGIGVRGGNTPFTDRFGQPHETGFVLSDKLTTNSSKYLNNI